MKRAILIAYDISHPKRRYRALKILKRWRLDGQKSVHECMLTTEQAQNLKNELTHVMNAEEDKLLMVWLDNTRPIQVFGTGKGLNKLNTFYHRSYHGRASPRV